MKYAILLLLLIPIAYGSICYQETATNAAGCALSGGSYSDYVIDDEGVIEITYQKPPLANESSKWKAKYSSSGFYYQSLPASCWNQPSIKVRLRSGDMSGITGCSNRDGVLVECFSGSWQQIDLRCTSGTGSGGDGVTSRAYDGNWNTGIFWNENDNEWEEDDGINRPGAMIIWEEAMEWVLEESECTKGVCCNIATQQFHPVGTSCGTNKECFDGGVCASCLAFPQSLSVRDILQPQVPLRMDSDANISFTVVSQDPINTTVEVTRRATNGSHSTTLSWNNQLVNSARPYWIRWTPQFHGEYFVGVNVTSACQQTQTFSATNQGTILPQIVQCTSGLCCENNRLLPPGTIVAGPTFSCDGNTLINETTVCQENGFSIHNLNYTQCSDTNQVCGITGDIATCIDCVDNNWVPNPATVCASTNFIQTNGCSLERPAVGTKNCEVSNVQLRIANILAFDQAELTQSTSVDMMQILQNYLQTCVPDQNSYCQVPIKTNFEGESPLTLDALSITFEQGVNPTKRQLGFGWNLMAFNPSQIYDAQTAILLKKGWNLIGYSNAWPIHISQLEIIHNAQSYTVQQAVDAQIIQESWYYFNQSYYSIPQDDVYLRPFFAYWIYAWKENTLQIPGTQQQVSQLSWSQLLLDDITIDQTNSIQQVFYRFDANTQRYVLVPIEEVQIYPWTGYWIYANEEDLWISS